jgi:hypothetical protein
MSLTCRWDMKKENTSEALIRCREYQDKNKMRIITHCDLNQVFYSYLLPTAVKRVIHFLMVQQII